MIWIYSAVVGLRQREAENILFYYREKIILQMRGTVNEATALAQTAHAMKSLEPDAAAWFEAAAAPLMERPEVRMVGLFEGDVLTAMLPRSKYEKLTGQELRNFSYIYTMSKVVKELVVEGPVVLQNDPEGQEVFLFLQPIIEEDAYLGQVAVALERDYVLKQLGLNALSDQGYDYELWRVEPQNGSKEIVAGSRTDADFSHAQKTVFNLPTQWTLSIQPTAGWLSGEQRLGLILLCVLLQALLLSLVGLLYRSIRQKRALREADRVDQATGLYNRKGFTAALDGWLQDGVSPVTLFYFSIEGYAQAARLIGPDEEKRYLQSVPDRMSEYIHSLFLAGRLDEGSYIVALREEMDEQKHDDFAKGLSLELLLQVRIDGEKSFLMPRYQYIRCEPGKSRAAEQISSLIRAYYDRVSGESPIRTLTEKCRQLIEGKSDVVFDEYTDLEMMELSKTFNRYRRQVEQLAYSDPIFAVGNRLKFLRDTNMLISYDKKRRFSLYCVDICSFSQYNELFSADIGDEILHEVLRRLSRPFGSYLYRINGDVFLGVSLSGEGAVSFADRLKSLFAEPVVVGNLSFPLQVRVAACAYPEHGETPSALLDHIQSVLRFAKEADQTVTIYNDQLDEMIRTEADILHRLKKAVRQETLEVWYQPIMRLADNRYSAAEALVRLSDGKGGYFSAGQVISLAERNGIVEELGDYVLRKACQFMHDCGGALELKRIGINLSVQQLLVGNSADHLLKLIHSAGIDPRLVTLEITESILIQSIDQAAQALEKLRRAGVHIALDDFGVGYSSLNYLSNLPVDIIKIDRSLTRQILTSPKQYALLKSIVEMASINELSVVAEGVETRAEQQAIANSGVHYIQGYYYARPMPEEELRRFLGH
ncbi:putative bifunctional diguanylate cyclase/phosphodiesterase [Candidatus Soleaferrea massiliensis]|uniref:putative bifunctional diguanylate cyclase/phosphodiesterase n=1 Tax=Candidatus Soleaferrea massiliensis TaxID=1470354 RepID=UPI001FA7F705|nr:GGDEF domain-containing phosphodiesterase [Candidatus Soleaferrea massiliensis]